MGTGNFKLSTSSHGYKEGDAKVLSTQDTFTTHQQMKQNNIYTNHKQNTMTQCSLVEN